METEKELNALAKRVNYWNKIDEAYGFLCLSISKDLLFHLTRLKTPNKIWEQLATLFYKKDDLRIYQLENEPISLNMRNFETMNYFFTKFKHLVLQLKQWEIEKEYYNIILSILLKLGPYYYVFVSTFHTGKLTIPNWKIGPECIH